MGHRQGVLVPFAGLIMLAFFIGYWWQILTLTAVFTAGTWLLLRRPHRAVVVQAPVTTPLVQAQLAARSLRPIPGSVQPALPRAMAAAGPSVAGAQRGPGSRFAAAGDRAARVIPPEPR